MLKFQTKSCLTDLNWWNIWLFVIMHQESKEDLSLKASRINLPSEHNSLISFSNNARLLAYAFRAEDQQSEWLKRDESNKVYRVERGVVFFFFASCLIRHYTNFWPYYWSGSYYRIWLFTNLWEVSIEYLQRVRHANRGRLLLQTPGPVPLWDFQVF